MDINYQYLSHGTNYNFKQLCHADRMPYYKVPLKIQLWETCNTNGTAQIMVSVKIEPRRSRASMTSVILSFR